MLYIFKDFKSVICEKTKSLDEHAELESIGYQSFHYNPQGEMKYVQRYKKIISVGNGEFELKLSSE